MFNIYTNNSLGIPRASVVAKSASGTRSLAQARLASLAIATLVIVSLPTLEAIAS